MLRALMNYTLSVICTFVCSRLLLQCDVSCMLISMGHFGFMELENGKSHAYDGNINRLFAGNGLQRKKRQRRS